MWEKVCVRVKDGMYKSKEIELDTGGGFRCFFVVLHLVGLFRFGWNTYQVIVASGFLAFVSYSKRFA